MMKLLQMVFVVLLFSSCAHKNSTEETHKFSPQFVKDHFDYKGTYVWAFDLMGSEQISTHSLYPDSITYKMTGTVYSTEYTMKKRSYEKEKNKWIGEDESGIVYVLFFKEKTDNTLTIYKHKCKSNGLEEAINFDLPAADATEDHGWNVYATNQDDPKDILPLAGQFSNAENNLFLSDSIFTLDQKKVVKMSFHSGERRWVGQYQDQYLQVFFKSLDHADLVQVSLNWSDDLEELYRTKYQSINNWTSYARAQM